MNLEIESKDKVQRDRNANNIITRHEDPHRLLFESGRTENRSKRALNVIRNHEPKHVEEVNEIEVFSDVFIRDKNQSKYRMQDTP